MAKEKVKQDAKDAKDAKPADEAEAPKKKGGLFKILIPLIVLAAGGGGAWYFTQSGGKHKAAQQVKAKSAPPVYERLETFTVNLTGGEHYLQVELSLKLPDSKVGEDIKMRMPEIRDGVLRLLSAKKVEDINTPEGKTGLSEEIRKQINTILNVQGPEQGITGVLFTSFVIQ
jgi:flagellar FliL protein